MKISACFIAKNEEKNIVRALESIKQQVDELILVDTGSEDKTVDIFHDYGGKVYYQPWNNDFSSPRNFSLLHATGDWIILLDADEYFSLDTADNLRKVIEENSQQDALMINITNINVDDGRVKDSFYNLRAVRNQQGIGYSGKIHEQLLFDGRPFSKIKAIDKAKLNIIHTGYSDVLLEDKARRNLAILLSEIAEGRNEAECYTYLAECYDSIGDIENMLKYAKLDVAQGRRLVSYASRSYRKLMKYYAVNNDMEQRYSIVKNAVKDFPELPEFHGELSICYYQQKRYHEAISELEKAIVLYENYNGIEPCLLKDSDLKTMKNNLVLLKNMSNNITISACLICKNEAENIQKWIDNVKEFADEIIIVDTGSEDETVNVIKENGIKCFQYNWNGSFADAKNYAIEKAHNKWIIFTDSDETFYQPKLLKAYVKDLIEHDKNIDAIMVPISNVDENFHDVEISRFNGIRIFRCKENIRYFGKIHEALSDINAPGDVASLNVAVADTRLLIRHTGYSSNKIKAKLYRNKELLHQDIEKNGLQERHYRYLAENYYGLGNYVQALKYSFLAMDSSIQAVGQISDMYWLAANSLEELHYSKEEREALLEHAMTVCSDIPDFYGLYGLLIIEDNIELAGKYLEKSLMISKDIEKIFNSTNFQQITDKIYVGLGRCYGSRGDKKMGIEYFLEALKINKWQEEAIIGLADLYGCEPNLELLELLDSIYDYQADLQGRNILARIFDSNGAVELAKVFNTEEKYYYNLLREGKYDDIMQNLPVDMVYSMQMVFISLLSVELDLTNYTCKKQLELLPGNLSQLVLAYHIESEKVNLTENMFEEYNSLLTVIMLQTNQYTKERYLEMAKYFSEEAITRVITVAVENEQWSSGLNLCQYISADGTVADGKFWFNAGRCLYNLGNILAAEECFGKASSLLNGDAESEALAYLSWCKEALA